MTNPARLADTRARREIRSTRRAEQEHKREGGYRLRGILILVLLCVIVGGGSEELSLNTGFPFGHITSPIGIGYHAFALVVRMRSRRGCGFRPCRLHRGALALDLDAQPLDLLIERR